MGIEFKQKDRKVEENDRYPERVRVDKRFSPAGKPGILGTIKKVFDKKDNNLPLKELLNKTLATPAPVPLDSLKSKIKEVSPSKDRSANKEEMDKLKNLIQEKIEKTEPKKEEPISTGAEKTRAGSSRRCPPKNFRITCKA